MPATAKGMVLVIDDEPDHAEAVAEGLERIGLEATVANSGEDGIRLLGEKPFDVVVTDLKMDGRDGMDVLKAAKAKDENLEVILISAHGSVKSAVQAMEKGAFSFVEKPLNIEELRAKVKKALQMRSVSREKADLIRRADKKYGFENIIGRAPAMEWIFDILPKVAASDATVLLTGESGTGKELVARAIHQNSPRKKYPFVAINLAALSESIIESELFGHEKGAFTGAIASREGKFEYADGGTLFLDEVADMPGSTQVKLLRVVEDGEIMRVGSNRPIKVNVRIISATNVSLDERIKEGSFRDDLYFRLRVVTIDLPPLRERREDIPAFTQVFLTELSEVHHRKIAGFTPEAWEVLQNYPWPGNVRELRNCIESAIVMSHSEMLGLEDIPSYIRKEELRPARRSPLAGISVGTPLAGISLEEAERELIKNTLLETRGNREEAAKILGIGARTLYRKLKIYNLS